MALLVFVSASGTLGWMVLMPSALRLEVESRTGFPVEIESFSSNPFGVSLSGSGIVVGNPGAYGGTGSMLDIERLEASLSLPALGRGEIWIHDLELRIARATLVVEESGRLNLDAFVSRLFAREDGLETMPFYAERVRLVVDELVFMDNSQVLPRQRSVRALLDVELSDVKRPRDLFAPLLELGRSVGSLPIE